MKKAITFKSIPIYGLTFILLANSCGISEKKGSTLQSDRRALYENYCMPELADNVWYTSSKKAPLFKGLDGIRFKITTTSREAQAYFNQGMMLAYGFNHAEAARSFYEAARLDTSCAMCQWGFAYVLGPNYNAGMEPDNLQRAFDAVSKAQKLSGHSSKKEKDLINALAARYSIDASARRSALDSSYAAEMRKVYQKYPKDEDIAAIFAESLMDLHPWDLFRSDGNPQPWTPEIIEVLENSLKTSPRHAGLNHYYIHALEMSNEAGKALASATLLGNLVPGSGHLVHMPSHTYIRTGHYHEGALSNMEAVKVDSAYTEACHAFGVYPLAYYPHNYHFLAACATLDGESRIAMIGAYQTKAHAYKKLLLNPYFATTQHFYIIPLFVQVKLGRWNEIQNTPEPDQELKYPRIIWNYAQGMAALAQKKPKKAEKYLNAMNSIMKDTSLRNLKLWGVNNLIDVCRIASQSLDGEIHAKNGDYEDAVRLLKNAMALEDQLRYQEPPDWFFSVRHNLGAVLIESGKYNEAIEAYKQDLKKYPENGWALVGMMNAYNKLGDRVNYEDSKKRFDLAWKYADMKITSSRIL
jgi:tetratricopeptide (TPR) repeat protein